MVAQVHPIQGVGLVGSPLVGTTPAARLKAEKRGHCGGLQHRHVVQQCHSKRLQLYSSIILMGLH